MQMHRIGNYTVTRIEEQSEPGSPRRAVRRVWMKPSSRKSPCSQVPRCFHGASGVLISSIHTWLVRGEGHVILIDTGCVTPRNGLIRDSRAGFTCSTCPFWSDLRAAVCVPRT